MSLVNCSRWKLPSTARAERLRESGLADAGHVLDQQMAARKQTHEGHADNLRFAAKAGLDRGFQIPKCRRRCARGGFRR